MLTGMDKTERKEMTDDEVALYNYLYATEPEKAEEYLNWLTSSLYGRQRRRRRQDGRRPLIKTLAQDFSIRRPAPSSACR
jgi:hypothetical protein